MVDYSVSGVPEALLPNRAGPVHMKEQALMALLECPLCSRRLDASAKVLPCQHTFCMSCLQRQEAAQSQLLCPECRTPVPARTVEELPTSHLLVRLLEGIQNSPRPSRDRQTARYAVPLARGDLTVREGQQQQQQQQQQEGQHREKQGYNEVSAQPSHSNPLHPWDAEPDWCLILGVYNVFCQTAAGWSDSWVGGCCGLCADVWLHHCHWCSVDGHRQPL